MAANVPEVVVPPPPDRDPFDQALSWVRFGNEVNCHNIRNEGKMEAFNDFVGLTVSNI